MNGRGEPRHQPIGMLPTIAQLIDEGLADTSKQYATLFEARAKPWVLDDALVERSKRVNGEALGAASMTASSIAGWVRASRSLSAAR